MPDSAVIIKLNKARVLYILLAVVVLLVILSIYGQYIRYFPRDIDVRGPWHEMVIDTLNKSFFLDNEGNIPTYFNALLLFIPSILLAVIAAWKNVVRDKFRVHWTALSFIFLLLSVDEAAVLHEQIIKPIRAISEAGGVLYFGWVIPGVVVVILFLIVYLMFFLHLDRKFKILFFISLGLYISGVLGGEMVSGYFAERLGQKNFTYAIVASLEESVEMIGASLIIYSLLEYIQQYMPEGLRLKV